MLDKLKDRFGKVDKKALGMAVGVMLLSWAALPIVYFLIVRKKKAMKEVKKDESIRPLEEVKEDGNME